jgi:hypothetical protein
MRGKAGLFSRNPIITPALLLHFDGTNGSTSFVDSSPNAFTVTASGDAEISTTQSKFGGSSLSIGSGYVYVGDDPALEFNAQDFTIDFWYYKTGFGYTLAGKWGSQKAWFLADSSVYVNGNEVLSFSAASSNEWHHYAFCRRTSTIQAFVDGAEVGSTSIGTDAIEDNGEFVGVGSDAFGNTPIGGYIDEFRIVVGTCIYGPDNFTPPTAPF